MATIQTSAMITAREKNIAQCRLCHTITDRPGESCFICGSPVQLREPHSLQKVMALWVAGIIAFVLGNIYPIMITESFSGITPSTIIDGVATLFHHGSYMIALVVFVASIVVPVSKFVVIAVLTLSVARQSREGRHQRHQLHRAIEFVGRWSMIDVFVVAALGALIQLGGIVTIKPGIGIYAFALSVVLTMLSAMYFDPRLIWDNDDARQ